MSHASSVETKEQILDVAERAIAENGYAGTTLRSVVSKANVNLAAIHYHFGSKEELFRAVIARMAQPIVSGHLTALEAILAETDTPSVEAILRAYLQSSFDYVTCSAITHPTRAQFMGRCRTEPDPVQSIADKQFRPSTEKFLDALQRSLPNQTRSQLKWKLDLVVTSLIRVLGEAGKPDALLNDTTPEGIEAALSKLILFLLPALESE